MESKNPDATAKKHLFGKIQNPVLAVSREMKNAAGVLDAHEYQGGRILIVDDEVDFALSLVDILESRGYQVEVAHSVQSVREKVEIFDAQVALLDIRLGHDSGIDLIAQVEEARPGILCVMMTAYAAVDTAVEALHRGAYDYLHKPLNIEYLLATLKRCFEKLRLESEKAAVVKALQRRNRELALLNRIGQELSATLNLQQVANRSLQEITETIGTEGASIWMWETEKNGWLVCQAALPQHRSMINQRVRPGQGIVGWVAQQGESVVVASVSADPRFFSGIDAQTSFVTRSLLAVPLRVRGAVIGVLEAVNKLRGDFSADDLALVETLTASTAIALDNARLIESLQRRTAELEARNQDLDAYAHTVAHDLKGPLGYMVGFAHVLEQDYAELAGEQVRRHLHTIAQSGRKMSNIIDELLLLAGLRDAEMEVGPLDMAHIVHQVEVRLAYMVEEYQAEILSSPPGVWPVALGHGPWVEEVWANYLSNALKYGGQPEEGIPPRIELGFDERASERMADGEWTNVVRFWVRDNGPGLTPEEQGRLFRSFERLDLVRVKGHGLGLSIARRIVNKLGGQVGVESEIGAGSIFWFTLPAQSSE